MREWLALRAVVLAAATLCLSACGLPGDGTGGASQELLPSSSTTDWVTYGDMALRARALEVVEVPPSAEELQAGEGIIGRQVKLGVEDILWEQPSREVDAPQTVVIDAGGWAFHEDSRKSVGGQRDAGVRGGARLSRGAGEHPNVERGLASVDAHWRGAMLPFDDGIVGRGEGVNADGGGARAAWGMTAPQVQELLAKTRPHPSAGSAMTLDALARLSLVQASSRQ